MHIYKLCIFFQPLRLYIAKYNAVKACLQHLKWTELKPSTDRVYSNDSVHSTHSDWALTILVSLQPIKSRSGCAWPKNVSCNRVDLPQFSSIRALWTAPLQSMCSELQFIICCEQAVRDQAVVVVMAHRQLDCLFWCWPVTAIPLMAIPWRNQMIIQQFPAHQQQHCCPPQTVSALNAGQPQRAGQAELHRPRHLAQLPTAQAFLQ